ncbi:MAG: DUF2298 domain-containing protein, partial [Halobacteriota archaeon]
MEYILVAWWLVTYGVLGVLGYPIAARLFARFTTSGVGFSIPIALVVTTVVAYWVGHVSFGPIALGAGLFALLVLSGLALFDLAALRKRRVALAASIDPRPTAAVDAAVVFVAAFLLVVLVRSADPAVFAIGGEKFLDYGLLRSIGRAETLPPESMWFAGESVRYYYGGHLMTVLLSMLSATSVDFAYNLALAGFFAMVVTAAYDLATAIAADHGYPARLSGVFAAVFVGLAGNLATIGWILAPHLPERLGAVFAAAWATGSSAEQSAVLEGTAPFSYWAPSRVVPGTINEFPFFAWLNGDLHAHMMGTPFLLLGAAIAYSYWQTPERARTRRRILLFGAIPIVGGLQVVVDTWSVPTILGVTWLALAFAPAHPLGLLPRGAQIVDVTTRRLGSGAIGTEIGRTGGALVVAGAIGAVSVALGAPFLLSASSGQEVSILAAADRSSLGPLFVVHGAFVAAFLAYLFGRVAPGGSIAVLVGLLAIGVAGVSSSLPVLAIAGPLIVLGWVALRFDRSVGFETALLVGGAGLIGIVELVYVVEQAGPLRMNTVFKVYIQVWVLWAVSMGVVLGSFVRSRSPPAAASAAVSSRWPSRETRRVGGILAVGVLLVITLPYAGFALSDHFDRHDAGTLHAT